LGLVLLAIGLGVGLYERRFLDSSVANSMRVCSKKDSNYASWEQNFEGGVNETEIEEDKENTIPLYKHFYLYNMTNPSDYLAGEVPVLVERGPYVLREYQSFLDVEFDGDNVTYEEWHYFVPQDGQDNKTENMFCEGCDINDEFHNLNGAYLRLLGQGQNEGSLILAATCTAVQISNIAAALDPRQAMAFCNNTAKEPGTSALCGCCNPYAGIPTPADMLKCEDLYATTGKTGGLFSLLSYYDGAPPVAGSGKTSFTQAVYSSLIVAKTARELALGYPTALSGYMLAKATAQGAAAAYPGSDAALRGALAKQATYTAQVGSQCADLCEALTLPKDLNKLFALLATGNLEAAVNCDARLPRQIPSHDVRFLSGVSCRPYAFSMLTALVCDPSIGGSGCECADGSDWSTGKGCCLAKGSNSQLGLDSLAGLGCLYEVPGIIGDRNFVSAQQVRDFYGTNHRAGEFTGCETDENGKKTWERAGWGSLRNGQTQQDLWQWDQADPTNDFLPPSPGRTAVFQDAAKRAVLGGKTYTSTIRGSLGMRFPGLGVSSELWSNHLTKKGQIYNETFQVYVAQAKRPVSIEYSHTASLKGVDTNVYKTNKKIMDRDFEDNAKTGTGVPMNGADCLTYNYGFPVFVHRPNYLYGDAKLLTQKEPPARLEYTGTRSIGVKLYRSYGYGPQSKPLESLLPIDAAAVDEYAEEFDTAINIEPASGLAVAAHSRLGASFAVFSCDPNDAFNPSCGLFPNSAGQCYTQFADKNPLLVNTSFPCSAANVFSPKVIGDILVPQYWVDQTSELNDHAANQLSNAGTLHLVAGIALILLAPFGGILLLSGIYFMHRTYFMTSSKQAESSYEAMDGMSEI